SSSSDSEQEEVHYLMADQTFDDELFDFFNIEFTLEDLISALNDMVKKYKNLSHTFEEVKAENNDLKNSSVEPSVVELGEDDSLKIELSKLKTENELLRNESSELKAEIEKSNLTMSSWAKSSASLDKLFGIQKPTSDRTGLGFNSSESSEGETSTQSQLVYDKFNKMSFVKANVIYDPCITDSACKNQLVVVSVQYGPFNTYIPIRSMTIGKSRVAIDPIAMHTSWRSNSDITSFTSIGYPRMRASGESSTTNHRLLHASRSHPIPPPNDPNEPFVAGVEGKQAETTADSATVETIFESVAEPVSEPAVADVVNEGPSTTDDVDDIIQQVLTETAQIGADKEEIDGGGETVSGSAVGSQAVDKILGTKKTISNSYICPADGSQYYRSAVGLVFMEWAAGLAMETSIVESAVRNQARAKLNQLEHDEPAETMTTSCSAKERSEPAVAIQEAKNKLELDLDQRRKSAGVLSVDDISSDVIIQQKLQWNRISRELLPAVELKEQSLVHGLRWDKMCCSKIFEGRNRDRGAVIARSNINTKSSYWIRTMFRVDGTWVIEPFSDYGKPIPGEVTSTDSIFFAVISVLHSFVQYSLFSGLSAADISSFVSTIAMDRTVLRNVQNSVSVAPSVQLIDERPSFAFTSEDSSMHFDETDTVATSPFLPTVSTDVQDVLAQLRAYVEHIQVELLGHKDDVDKIRETISLHIHDLERKLTERFDAHDRTYRVLFNNVRHDMQDHKNLLSLDLKTYQQKVSNQVGAAALDVVDVRRVVKELDAKVAAVATGLDDVCKDVEGTKEAISHQILDFRA
ncbi:hypothetical protein F511_31413, partial [Dorcoceras hygrometricum]